MDGLNDGEKLEFLQTIVLNAVKNRYPQQAIVTGYLYRVLDGLLRFAGETELSRFLTSVEALNVMWHKDAITYLKQV